MHNDLSGPDFLDSLADTETGNGLDINANEYRKRAQQWRELEQQSEATAREVSRLSLELATLRKNTTRVAAELANA